jgi:hypothetical protein
MTCPPALRSAPTWLAAVLLWLPASGRADGPALQQHGRSVTLGIEGMRPTWSMEIKYAIKAADGTPVRGFLHNTIHRLED